MKIEKAGFIAFPAADFEASVIFYRDHLGFPVLKEGKDGLSRFARFDCPDSGSLRFRATALRYLIDGRRKN